ncbi:uncharacterized protein LOC122797874 [Protopterus annectens]|uniref:uncharacterized protein LOC122797874 n=1 Tax=Protopterus annectens TaxID=7888 RepID=UPI001CFB7C93|nr:uncharacterized protein LOC122797874 [Protopterus annectens]
MDLPYEDSSSNEESFDTSCHKNKPFIRLWYNQSTQCWTLTHLLSGDSNSVLSTQNKDSTTDMEELHKISSSDEESASTSVSDINMTIGGVCSNQSSKHYSAEHGLQATVSNKAKPECSRSKNLMKDNSIVTPELSEHKGAACEQYFDLQMEECKTVLMDFKKALSAVQGVDKVHISEWFAKSNKLLKQTDSNSDSLKTHIAVVGDTGAGKSSLLNALLDEEDLLPSCSMRACTASVVEVSCNTKNQKYEANVEFLTKEVG